MNPVITAKDGVRYQFTSWAQVAEDTSKTAKQVSPIVELFISEAVSP